MGDIDDPVPFDMAEHLPYSQGKPTEKNEESKGDKTINLEEAVELEKQFTKILDCLRNEIDPTSDCEDWWVVTDPSTYTLCRLPTFYRDSMIVREIVRAQKLETISVSLIQFLSFENSLEKALWVPLKNLIFFVHQNCLVQVKFLLERLPMSSKANSWAIQLRKILDSKLTRLYKDRAEALQALKVNNESSKSVLLNICKIKPKQPIYFSVVALIKELDNVTISKIRDMMFNTIQYRDGKLIAVAIDEMNGFTATKSAGFGGGGSNSQVFNPHSAPAINSPSHVFFDDELPPVEEPFLPP